MEGMCQSCGMPMMEVELAGTNGDGSRNGEYCRFCYQGGEFNFKGGYEEFVELQVRIAREKMDMPEDQARELANSVLPGLRRWK